MENNQNQFKLIKKILINFYLKYRQNGGNFVLLSPPGVIFFPLCQGINNFPVKLKLENKKTTIIFFSVRKNPMLESHAVSSEW